MARADPPAPFDATHIEAVASEFEVDAARLGELIVAHQDLVDRLPGVDNLVYEWRKQFDATVVVQTDDWYFVVAPGWAWEEFGDSLETSDAELAALAALHARIIEAHPDTPDEGFDDASPVVLLRD